ncbi:RNA polymerase sigma factor [Ulvibacter antarcticus]|uniref:RNA polymerase sigma-70 factor (ECF subfamily) n=1 Tax=Ulvibacter antarcticus TaxID=442714 RepID=A0A3L9YE41_9FLAO|nr:RNA polymerase sigma factor [Ulvibacter antarcticus]RMA57717.1 RNA polymerase sigma-70 factor (ECF subfamily) [Ulvibacter antarcticus]
MTLNELIKNCKKNNREAQSELFRRYKDALFLVSLKYCRNVVEAEDNLHDAFITIFQKIKTYKNKGSFEGWMKRITIYKAIDSYKANRHIPIEIKNDLLEDDTTVLSKWVDLPLDALLGLIQELPDQYRLVFSLYQLDGFSHKEVAAMLQISEGTSKSNYHRAKQLLRTRITDINSTSQIKATEK